MVVLNKMSIKIINEKWRFYRTFPFAGMLIVLGLLVYLQETNFDMLIRIAGAFLVSLMNIALIISFLYMVMDFD